MALLPIIIAPDPRLKITAEPVDQVDDDLLDLGRLDENVREVLVVVHEQLHAPVAGGAGQQGNRVVDHFSIGIRTNSCGPLVILTVNANEFKPRHVRH